MTRIGTIESLWRYPAKSMQGEALDALELTPTGVLGDRTWAARDEVRGGIRGAKKIGTLMGLSARYLVPPTIEQPVQPIVVTLPDGTEVRSDATDFDAVVSGAIDHPVTMWPLQPVDDLDHYRRGAPDSDDVLAELRNMFGRDDDEPLPDLSLFPVELFSFESPVGTYYDVSPVHLLTTTSLDSIGARLPDSVVDVRRFRPNVVVRLDDPDGEFPEQTWIGRTLTVGDADLDVSLACPRCVMPTRGFADLPTDRAILRSIVRDADQNLGVYASIATVAPINVGDEVHLLDG
jgi:uncharacterized protein YcbX